MVGGRATAAICALAVLGFGFDCPADAGQACPESSYAITPSHVWGPPYVPAARTQLQISVTAPDGCPWTAASNSPFISIVSGASGSGNGTVTYEVASNPAGLRTGFLTVAGFEFSLRQSGCISLLTNPAFSNVFPDYERYHLIDAAGGHRWLSFFMTSETCVGIPTTHEGWINVWGGGSGAGPNGSLMAVRYTVDANTSGRERSGTFSIGYLTVSVWQTTRQAADVNRDGHADLFWHHQTTGHVATWLMNRLSLIDGRLLSPGQVPDTNWKVVGSGQFFQNGSIDLVWQHEDGRVAVWVMNGTTLLDGKVLWTQMADSDWRVRAVADFNGDGRPDLFWQHRTTGAMTVWLMFQIDLLHGVTVSPANLSDTAWQVVGAGDFDRDGHTDLLWQNQADGRISVWLMAWYWLSGYQGSGTLLNPGQVSDTNWKIRGVADIDRDGQPDIIWQNQANGLISTWLMDGINLRDGILFSPGQVADTDWVIVGPR